jgi:hypothetical protein
MTPLKTPAMTMLWLQSPYLDLDYVATKLYGSKSRLHTQRLKRKMRGGLPFESWEIEKLEQMKGELSNTFQIT